MATHGKMAEISNFPENPENFTVFLQTVFLNIGICSLYCFPTHIYCTVIFLAVLYVKTRSEHRLFSCSLKPRRSMQYDEAMIAIQTLLLSFLRAGLALHADYQKRCWFTKRTRNGEECRRVCREGAQGTRAPPPNLEKSSAQKCPKEEKVPPRYVGNKECACFAQIRQD